MGDALPARGRAGRRSVSARLSLTAWSPGATKGKAAFADQSEPRVSGAGATLRGGTLHPCVERSAWTDERLDDMVARIDSRFDRLEAELAEMRIEMREGFRDLGARIDDTRRDMFHGVIAIFGALVAVFAVLLAQGP